MTVETGFGERQRDPVPTRENRGSRFRGNDIVGWREPQRAGRPLASGVGIARSMDSGLRRNDIVGGGRVGACHHCSQYHRVSSGLTRGSFSIRRKRRVALGSSPRESGGEGRLETTVQSITASFRRRPESMLKVILKLDACGTLRTWIPASAGMTLWVVWVPILSQPPGWNLPCEGVLTLDAFKNAVSSRRRPGPILSCPNSPPAWLISTIPVRRSHTLRPPRDLGMGPGLRRGDAVGGEGICAGAGQPPLDPSPQGEGDYGAFI